MVRQLKKFKEHYQEKKKEAENRVFGKESELEAKFQQLIEQDSTLKSLVATGRKMVRGRKRILKRLIDEFQRKLRDLEELCLDRKGLKFSENLSTEFDKYIENSLSEADKELSDKVTELVSDIQREITVFGTLLI